MGNAALCRPRRHDEPFTPGPPSPTGPGSGNSTKQSPGPPPEPSLPAVSDNVLKKAVVQDKEADRIIKVAQPAEEIFMCLEKAQSTMKKLDSLLPVDVACLGGETSQVLVDALKLAAVLAVPPPGGEIIAAAITLTVTVIRACENKDTCRSLAKRCSQLVHAVYGVEQFKANYYMHTQPSGGVKEALAHLNKSCTNVCNFVENLTGQSRLEQMVSCQRNNQRLIELDKQLLDAQRLLNTALLCKQTEDVQEIKALVTELRSDCIEVEQFLKQHGGMDAVMKDRAKKEALIGMARGTDKVLLETVFAIMESKQRGEEDERVYSWNNIKHPTLKDLWKSKFYNKEKVYWSHFFEEFPDELSQIPDVDPSDVKLLKEELDGAGKAKLMLVCDTDRDQMVSTLELSRRFPPGENLVDQVKLLKALPDKGWHMKLPTVRNVLCRQETIDKICDAVGPDGPDRMALVVGGPGEGKRSVAVKALLQLYDDFKAKGGVWHCSMEEVQSSKDMLDSLMEGLTLNVKPHDEKAGSEATFKVLLNSIAKRGAEQGKPWDTYLLIDHCERLINSTKAKEGEAVSLHDQFFKLLLRMLKEAPNLKLVVCTRRTFPQRELEELRLVGGLFEWRLPKLSDEEGASILLDACDARDALDDPRGNALAISKKFNANPFLMCIIGKAIDFAHRDGDPMYVRKLLEVDNLAQGDMYMDEVENMDKVARRVMHSLDGLSPEIKTLALKMALILPGPADAEAVTDVLCLEGPVTAKAVATYRNMLNKLVSVALLERLDDQSGGGKERAGGLYRVTSVFKEVAGKMHTEESEANAHHITTADLQPHWVKLITQCCRLVENDFRDYRLNPIAAYISIEHNKRFVHRALRLVYEEPDIAATCLEQLLDMLSFLPYLAMAHDANVVQRACEALESLVSKDGAELGGSWLQKEARALCKTVRAYFARPMSKDDRTGISQSVDAVSSMLIGSTSEQAQLIKAMALRRKGVVQRDNETYPESEEALRTAFSLLEGYDFNREPKERQELNQLRRRVELEHILCLAELAGTLDYQNTDKHKFDESGILAEAAKEHARAFYGDGQHPVLALCWTTQGYFLKGKGKEYAEKAAKGEESGKAGEAKQDRVRSVVFHEQAIKCHEEAKTMRTVVLGDRHLEVALSWQQMAISQMALGRFEEAEDALRKHSLEIRRASVEKEDLLLFNTYRELANLYELWPGKLDMAEASLRDMLANAHSRKHEEHIKAAAGRLVKVLKAQGKGAEAAQVQV